MSLLEMIGNLFVFILVTATIGFAISSMKGDLLWPMLASCPDAFSHMMNLYGQIGNPDKMIQDIWDCSIGAVLFIALPGIGISWVITKHIT